jgi:hypothetical protein
MGRGGNSNHQSENPLSTAIKVWLDDDLVYRPAPEGWIHVTTAPQAIEYLRTGNVVELSLDHDLGDDQEFGRGVDVVDFLCEQQFNNTPCWPKTIHLHTANSYGRDSMLRSITRYNDQYQLSWVSGQPTLAIK